MVKIILSNKLAYTFIAFGILVLFATGISSAAANPGHPISQIDPPPGCVAGRFIKWTGGTNYVCEAVGAGLWSQGSGGKIYYDGGNVGIGEVDPDQALVVDGNVQITSSNRLYFGTDATGEYIYSTRSGNYPLKFATGGADRMAITNTGAVGIGTTTPAQKLDVSGNIIASGTICANGGSDCVGSGSGGGYWARDTVNGEVYPSPLTDQVGIGISDPTHKLSVRETSSVTTSAVDTAVISAYSTGNMGDNFGPALEFNIADSGASNEIAYIAGVRSNADNKGELRFGTNYLGMMEQRMRILSEGPVLIGGSEVPSGWNYMFEVTAESSIPNAILGYSGGSGTGVRGVSATGTGVAGVIATGPGVGVYGSSTGSNGIGIQGVGTNGAKAGYFVGNVEVLGTFTASTKNFKIDHPTQPNYELVHSSLEGPESAVFYRGEAQLINREIVIELPEYFEFLVRIPGRTVLLTPKFDDFNEPVSQLATSEIKNGKFTIKAIDTKNPSQKFYWEVKGVRADIDPLEVEQLKAKQ